MNGPHRIRSVRAALVAAALLAGCAPPVTATSSQSAALSCRVEGAALTGLGEAEICAPFQAALGDSGAGAKLVVTVVDAHSVDAVLSGPDAERRVELSHSVSDARLDARRFADFAAALAREWARSTEG